MSSPVVRHLAHAHAVDLTQLHGTGPDAVITRTDVEAAAAKASSPTPARAGVRASPLARRRAADLGVDLAAVVDTGPDGAVIVSDLM